ncbi:hypothetical protein D1872_336790 [compost metagenome]
MVLARLDLVVYSRRVGYRRLDIYVSGSARFSVGNHIARTLGVPFAAVLLGALQVSVLSCSRANHSWWSIGPAGV